MAGNQVRVLLWCTPRSVSTTFAICMSNLEDVQVINEPYLSAILVGPENRLRDKYKELKEQVNKVALNLEVECKNAWESEGCSYEYMKDNLEAEYPEKKVIFVKDMPRAITEKLHMLPQGYRHAFLIRKPEKVFPSVKKFINDVSEQEVMLTDIVSKHYYFGESLQLYEHLIKTGIEPKPFIMDADDLLENPESMLRQFCSFAGIEYTDRLLAWDKGIDATRSWKTSKELLQWREVGDWHKHSFTSKGFNKATPAPPRSELSDDVLHCIDAGLPFYRKLYELRARIN